MTEKWNSIVVLFFVGVVLMVMIAIIVRAVKNKCAPVGTVKAVVVDKHIVELRSAYSGNGKHKRYVVVFTTGGRKLSFYVSPFSFDGYKINQKGTLTYRGDKIIGFD